jgi:hypothetical protein
LNPLEAVVRKDNSCLGNESSKSERVDDKRLHNKSKADKEDLK